jgi:CheY-like chemotaxis protein
VEASGDGNTEIAIISLAVEDEGPGISEENQKLLFSNFVQIKPGDLQNGQGSGLGLSFCKELVRLHKGNINVQSKEGVGSIFKFSIPFPIASSSATSSAASEPSAVIEDKNSIWNSFSRYSTENRPIDGWLSTLEVLIVDDSIPNSKMLNMLLKRKGIKSSIAENGMVAVDLVLKDFEAYKLILMDNLMPVMNGMDATACLRKAGYPYLIIGLTGNIMEDDVKDFLSVGADMVLSKPLQMSSLERIIDTISMNGPLSTVATREETRYLLAK